jgi:hypothetical protein
MYNPDQHYQAHALHLKNLSDQVEQSRRMAALPQHRPAMVRAARMRLSVAGQMACAKRAARRAAGVAFCSTAFRWHVTA